MCCQGPALSSAQVSAIVTKRLGRYRTYQPVLLVRYFKFTKFEIIFKQFMSSDSFQATFSRSSKAIKIMNQYSSACIDDVSALCCPPRGPPLLAQTSISLNESLPWRCLDPGAAAVARAVAFIQRAQGGRSVSNAAGDRGSSSPRRAGALLTSPRGARGVQAG